MALMNQRKGDQLTADGAIAPTSVKRQIDDADASVLIRGFNNSKFSCK